MKPVRRDNPFLAERWFNQAKKLKASGDLAHALLCFMAAIEAEPDNLGEFRLHYARVMWTYFGKTELGQAAMFAYNAVNT